MAAANAELAIRVRALRGMDRQEREIRGVGRGAHRAASADGGGRPGGGFAHRLHARERCAMDAARRGGSR